MMTSESEPSGYIGSMVSIDCGILGTYQGHVKKIDPVMNTLTITHAFHNGLSCDQPEVNLSSTTIRDIKIIHASQEAKEIITRKATPSKMTKEIDEVTKPTCSSPVKIIKATSKARTGFQSATTSAPVAKKTDSSHIKGGCRRKLSPPDSPSRFVESGSGTVGPKPRMSKSANREPSIPEVRDQHGNGHGAVGPADVQGKMYPAFGHHGRKVSAGRKMERGGKRGTNSKNSECFSAPSESILQDFDFESNLALFNKKAVYQEIENGFPDLSLDNEPQVQKYRHDENVLQPGESNATPIMKQQIKVPETSSQLYYTDIGLVVPSISLDLRNKLCETSAMYGLTLARQLEAFGRAASEMVIHLIGGSHRIHPKNDHQMPVVVVLCGPYSHSSIGVCCARVLSSHGVQVTVVMPPSRTLPGLLKEDLELFKFTGGKLVQTVEGIPDTIDLIVNAMETHSKENITVEPWYQNVVTWLKNSDTRAQVLALDPPPRGPKIPAKWSLCKVLPLSELSSNCGSLYLCDLSIPSALFKKCGVTYVSPFGSKFVIPLYMQE